MDWVGEISRKMGLRQVEQGFFSFFAKYLPYLMKYDEIGFFGHPEAAEKWIEGKLNKTFLHFLPNFCHF